jgi:hypothetical protein
MGFEQFLNGVRLATACEAGYVDKGNGAGDGDVELGVEGKERVPGFVWMKWINVGHDSVEAVFHVGDEIFGATDICAI